MPLAAAPVQPPVLSSVSPVELAAGIESLYRDQLRPYGRILRKRLAEIMQAAGRGDLQLGVKDLRSFCEACPWLIVADVEGADWSALVAGRQNFFVDVYSPGDPYPESMWAEAQRYFAGLSDAQMVLPGGRYSCAQVLLSRNLPFLRGCSLGQVCHIVQLAISQKKILGYLNGTVVPYGRSQSMIKERHAVCQQPCAGGVRSRGPVATWDTLRQSLQDLVAEVASSGNPVPLSNIKRLFRSKFHMELSETALGYAKVSELLQDRRLNDLCEVKLQGHGYVITAKPFQQKKAVPNKIIISLADSFYLGEVVAPPPPPLASPVLPSRGQPLLEPAPLAPGGGLMRRRERFNKPSLCMENILSPEELSPSVAVAAAAGAVMLQRPAPFLTSPATFVEAAAFPSTPSPCTAAVARSLPRLLGTQRLRHHPSLGSDGKSINGIAVAQSKPYNDTALALTGGVAERPYAQDPWILPPLTPSTMGILSSVHNTFISVPLPPPTPVKSGSRARARSLPKDSC